MYFRGIHPPPKSLRLLDSEWYKPNGLTEVLHINFDNTFIHLILNKDRYCPSDINSIVWKDPRTKGIDQSQLYRGISSFERKRRCYLRDSRWRLEFRSGIYVLSDVLTTEINKAVSSRNDENSTSLVHQWDQEYGLQGSVRCLHRLSFVPGPCEIGESTSMVIFSHSALLRSITDSIERLTPLPNYISRLIVEFAFLGAWAPNPMSLKECNGTI